ncbi:MAG: hypothetical protein MUP98_19395, partial [Candidatus Aminicenantes bacterium]|nr:hypothetical protein [Candidatus Aminicenantes bacterium]
MDQENELTLIANDDLSFLEKELANTKTPVSQEELVTKTAFKKTASLRRLEAKKYHPDCVYEIGDLLYKEYDEPLTVTSKGTEPFIGSVVLKVINKVALPDYNCEMLEVDYMGGGIFRKHVDYMKKSHTQVLLPSNCDGKAQAPEILQKADDPRMNELPMTDQDLKKLEKNLKSALSKSNKFFNWNNFWQLEANRISFKDKDIKKIEKYFETTPLSSATTDLISNLFDIDKKNELFAIHCLSLNFILEKDFKKKFVFVSPSEWGKWLSKETLDSFLTNLPITKAKARVPLQDESKHAPLSPAPEMPLKVYLTWREVLSGCIKIPKSMNRHFSQSREYLFTDTDGGHKYIVYYFPSSNIFCGLQKFYEKHNVPQGASLTIEKNSLTSCNFSLKKSKKKHEVPRLSYDSVKDEIKDTGEEAFTFSLPNKIIFLERETLTTLLTLYSQRKNADLKDLLILIFKNFGLEAEALTIHYQRAFHLVDFLKRTTIEDVENVLLNSIEFTQSEKSKGLFHYQIEKEPLEDFGLEDLIDKPVDAMIAAMVEEIEGEILPEIGTVGEIAIPEGPKIIEVIEPEKPAPVKPPLVPPSVKPARPPRPKKEIEIISPEEKASVEPPKKEKTPKKKKDRIKDDLERSPRRRRGEKRFIEERIELEESELETLIALKAEEAELESLILPEIPKIDGSDEGKEKDKKEVIEEYVSEAPSSSLFADKLKSALGKSPAKTSGTGKKPKKRRKQT